MGEGRGRRDEEGGMREGRGRRYEGGKRKEEGWGGKRKG